MTLCLQNAPPRKSRCWSVIATLKQRWETHQQHVYESERKHGIIKRMGPITQRKLKNTSQIYCLGPKCCQVRVGTSNLRSGDKELAHGFQVECASFRLLGYASSPNVNQQTIDPGIFLLERNQNHYKIKILKQGGRQNLSPGLSSWRMGFLKAQGCRWELAQERTRACAAPQIALDSKRLRNLLGLHLYYRLYVIMQHQSTC